MNPLVEEASKKAAIAWVAFGGPAYAVWCLPLEGKLYVVAGPGEQELPGLAEALEADAYATVSLRGDHGGRIVSFQAAMTQLHSNDTEWEAVAPQLAQKRLNASGTTEEVVARWASTCILVALAAQETVKTADDSEATAPRPASVLRETRKPFRLHKVKKR
ncbi:MAG: hypothetical protein HOU81_10625 [Hamadaea sp.]|uniref:hypothetical protein n=1 Tax=Hamadaea sp. TaxID=2024425 RepID=UPI0017B943E4|nr:hypothetical protein [Hamadaea sp.]NUR71264.1 hypothetical protein [Hamadaea sp.]NUT23132.1 hypothetical protein [Hamadaea sp.]